MKNSKQNKNAPQTHTHTRTHLHTNSIRVQFVESRTSGDGEQQQQLRRKQVAYAKYPVSFWETRKKNYQTNMPGMNILFEF